MTYWISSSVVTLAGIWDNHAPIPFLVCSLCPEKVRENSCNFFAEKYSYCPFFARGLLTDVCHHSDHLSIRVSLDAHQTWNGATKGTVPKVVVLLYFDNFQHEVPPYEVEPADTEQLMLVVQDITAGPILVVDVHLQIKVLSDLN